MNQPTAKRAIALLLGLALVAGACSGSSSDSAAVDDCVEDGSCAEGPDVETTDGGSDFSAAEGTYLGLPVGFTDDGFPYIGDPEASVSLVEFSDYLCPFCFRHTTQTTPWLLLEYATSGQVNFIFRDLPLAVLHPTSPIGHAASLCVAEQDPALWWAYHDELFRNQQLWADAIDPSDYLAEAAVGVGVETAAYADCVESGRNTSLVDERVAQGELLGFNSTPTFQLVRNETGETFDLSGAHPLAVFQDALDAMLAGEDPPGAVPSAGLVSQEGTGSATPATIPTFTVDPDSIDTYEGFAVGFTGEGFPYLGDPEASVSLVEFSDYLCPFCFRHATQTLPALYEQYAGGGDVNFVFRDFPLAGLHPTAPTGHTASLCVAEQGAAFFWAFHDSLFFNQQQWASLPDPTPFLDQTAQQIGADMDAYEACMESGRTAPIVDERVAQGRDFGFNGTPSFHVVNNETGDAFELIGAQALERFQQYLDAVIAGEAPPDAIESDEEQSAELPLWANEEGLAPDPARPGFNVAGDAYKGDPDAPLVVIEFGDFQCPACQRHALDTQPTIDETFVETGDIMWVFKNYPLTAHPLAPAAGAAAECAGDQGRFWEMHHLLYEAQEEWLVDDPDPVLNSLAGQLGLNGPAFAACLGGRDALERVMADRFEVEGIIARTPSFVFVYGGAGRQMEGARDVDDFIAILGTQLEGAIAAQAEEG